MQPLKDGGVPETLLSNRKICTHFFTGPRESIFFWWIPKKKVDSLLQKYYLIGGTPPEPNGFVDSAFRALSDFRVRGTREAGERWWGLAALSNARGERGDGY